MTELAPFVLQGMVMTVDEFYCHRRRELKKWERWGHPVDTLVFAACFGYLLSVPPSEQSLMAYAALSAFSCLMISKDEWQHRELCSGFENWLHSLLFILHPVVLIWAGYLWWNQSGLWALPLALASALIFFLYQTVYWNVWRRDR
jgi:hypothetical protein